MTERKALLTDWVRQQLVKSHGTQARDAELQNLSGDASFRRYFRTRLNGFSYIVVDAPPASENSHSFVRIARAFRSGGVLTPRIIAVDYEHGFMLQEDFGDELYLKALNRCYDAPDRVDALYKRAIDTLVTLQKNVSVQGFPPYDKKFLLSEMQLFQDW